MASRAQGRAVDYFRSRSEIAYRARTCTCKYLASGLLFSGRERRRKLPMSKIMRQVLAPIMLLRRLYWRIFRPETRGVRAILCTSNSSILLVRHNYDHHWYLPGGAVRRGEADEDAIRRELREELDITDISIGSCLGTYHSQAEYKKDTIVVFVASGTWRGQASRLEIDKALVADLNKLPADTSPATRRRIEEHLGMSQRTDRW